MMVTSLWSLSIICYNFSHNSARQFTRIIPSLVHVHDTVILAGSGYQVLSLVHMETILLCGCSPGIRRQL